MHAFVIPKGERADMIAKMAQFLGRLSKDKVWSVEVKEAVRSRSGQQNRFLWGICYPAILKHLEGWDAEDVHEYCLGEHFGWETIEGFGKKRLRPLRRSSKLTVIEFRDYVDWVQRTMAERGIYVPDANDGAW